MAKDKEVVDTNTEETVSTKNEKKEETVEIKRDDFNKLMETLKKQGEDIKMLYEASDKSRLAKVMKQDNQELINTVKVSKWIDTNLLVMSTKLLSNKCEIVMGKWYEDQQIAVVFDDGSAKTVPYLEFSRSILNKEVGEIVGKSSEKGDNGEVKTILKLKLGNGRELEIDSRFIN